MAIRFFLRGGEALRSEEGKFAPLGWRDRDFVQLAILGKHSYLKRFGRENLGVRIVLAKGSASHEIGFNRIVFVVVLGRYNVQLKT